jgi:hypothetical protein
MSSTTKSQKYVCTCCNKSYIKKTAYDEHKYICEFIHTSKRDQRRPLQLPSKEVMFNYIIDLTKKYENLEDKIMKIEHMLIYNKTKHITIHLKSVPPPKDTFENWMKTININYAHLEKLFEYNIISCIQSALEDKLNENTPIYAVEDKQNTLYLYDDTEKTWRLMSQDEFAKWMNTMGQRVLKTYLEWAQENRDYLESKDEDIKMVYLSKANGLNCKKERLYKEMKQWLYIKLAKERII